ncbi:hypothetical protein PVK06_007917 [Gossypium arboreum]|uniref:RNase H type-1 domain-containing protein n=1 Tax=Gossypium arboreum TaxID=29729 RepID=A0ABR0QJU7_GOSAR|nr:hypothetical protein PVK06_007917 [Gossypium arboreum]
MSMLLCIKGGPGWALFITRDSDGFVLRGRGMFKVKVVNSEWAELEALIEGISFARNLNLNKVNFEMDCTTIVNRVRKARADITIFGHQIKKVQNMSVSFSAFDIRWINRYCKKVVDFLCNWSLKYCYNLDFDMDYS